MNASGPYVEHLTRRENDILTLLAQNLTDREIAERLVLSLNSVKWYVRQVIAKFGVKNRKEAVARAQEIGLIPGGAPVIKTAHNLPRPLSSFIGREKEIDQVVRMVWEYPLVTLTGAGGVGKTRLAQVAAAELADDFTDGVWYVELASLANPQLLVQTIAGVVGIHEAPGRSLVDALLDRLYDHQVLLVLDNCEHLIQTCAEIAHTLLTHLPRLKVIVTSREPLGLTGEAVFRVPSLSYPQNSLPEELESCLGFESVRLFVERAQAVQTDFQLTAANAPLVAQICQWMDGNPLAIELTAARMRMLTVEQIAARLDQTFRLLTGGSRTELPRHQTLQALIDWSYYLLSPIERKLLLRLSVFAGGWTLEAAESVCADPDISSESQADSVLILKEEIVDLLGGLIDKSLIQFDPSRGSAPRYSMLVTVRQYARERLAECSEEGLVRTRHLEYFLSLALQAEPHLRSSHAKTWLTRLEWDLDNLRAALDCSISGPIEQGLCLSTRLYWFWWTRDHCLEGAKWLERLLQTQKNQPGGLSQNLEDRLTRGRALNALNLLIKGNFSAFPPYLKQLSKTLDQEGQEIFRELGEASSPRDYAIFRFTQAESVKDYLECRSLFQRLADPFWIAECDLDLSEKVPENGEWTFFYGEENIALRKTIGDMDGEGYGIYWLGRLELKRGNLDRAVELMIEGRSHLELAGNREGIAIVQRYLVLIAILRGDYQEAIHQCELLLTTARELNDHTYFYTYLADRAWIAWAIQDYEMMGHYCQEALELNQEIPLRWKVFTHYLLCRAAISQKKLTLARDYLKNILITEPFVYRSGIQAAAILAALEGQMQHAATLFGALDALCSWLLNTQSPPERDEYEQALASTRAALGDEAYSSAWEAGRAMTEEQVIQLARETGN
jgi:predicted ATPase/DNA-binding CsgD family transcriptional regulator/tetratricopeptide (TPR) repeat protein